MSEPKLTRAVLRESCGDIHIECSFDDGQKFAAVKVADGMDNLAAFIVDALNGLIDSHTQTDK